MRYDPQKHHRRSILLKGYDYTQAKAYFITIVTKDRACLFGRIVDGEIRLSHMGHIVRARWLAISDHFPYATVDEFVVMPNHGHGTIVLNETEKVGARHAAPQPPAVPQPPAAPRPPAVPQPSAVPQPPAAPRLPAVPRPTRTIRETCSQFHPHDRPFIQIRRHKMHQRILWHA